MGRIFCVMGKSATGKDTIYRELFNRKDISLQKVIPYTTRPIREGEENGREYFFCDQHKVEELKKQGKIIELRAYDTVYGCWMYFTADDGQIDLTQGDYLLIGTLDTYRSIRKYFGEEKVVPIYIEVEDGERLLRAIQREQCGTPKYEEMCRRFLSDAADFSEDNLKECNITKRFMNNNLEDTIEEIVSYIIESKKGVLSGN